jgi:hypothetical protein
VSEAFYILAVSVVIFGGPFLMLMLPLAQFPITVFYYTSSTADVCRRAERFIACSGLAGIMGCYFNTVSDMTDSFHK